MYDIKSIYFGSFIPDNGNKLVFSCFKVELCCCVNGFKGTLSFRLFMLLLDLTSWFELEADEFDETIIGWWSLVILLLVLVLLLRFVLNELDKLNVEIDS